MAQWGTVHTVTADGALVALDEDPGSDAGPYPSLTDVAAGDRVLLDSAGDQDDLVILGKLVGGFDATT